MPFRETALIIGTLIFLLTSCHKSGNDLTQQTVQPVKKKRSFSSTYGIPADSFDIKQGRVRPNVFFSDILLKQGVSMNEIDRITKNPGNVFDVRKIRSGNNYLIFTSKDSTARLCYFVYEHDPVTSYVFSFNDSLNITLFRKETCSAIRYASVTIETSLWDAMVAGGFNPYLAVELSDIFAWSVDFFDLQRGDRFKVIYEEISVDGKILEAGRIYGAQLIRKGSVITAIPFMQDDKESYFDAEGNSLRKAFLKAPLQFSRISSRFSSGRLHPVLRIRTPHFGVDYAAPVGTPVHSVGDGKIISAGTENGSGKIVRIQHNSVYSTTYLHLSGFGEGVAAGRPVRQGDIIGYVGSSGLTTGPHLDFRFFQNGYPVDPLKIDAPPVEPVTGDNMSRFDKIRQVIISLMETIN
jgi:murein DD-endopeptidase MepM/ murein hydrolase activator NlpD